MRLTLRTMLAYLDDVLAPADAQQLRDRINESEFARELVHRIRSSTRKMRLAAPDVEGQGVGVELNSVAEYLDNTLAEEQSSEFEQVCLESDVHLAEVASCHQILTRVLGEPAVVRDEVRRRVYQVTAEQETGYGRPAMQNEVVPPPHQTDYPDSPASAGKSVSPPAAIDQREAEADDLPEFMKPPRALRLWHVGVIGLVAASCLLVIPGIRQQFSRQQDVSTEVAQQQTNDAGDKSQDSSQQPAKQDSTAAVTAQSGQEEDSSADPVVTTGSANGAQPDTSSGGSSSLPSDVAPVPAPSLGKLVSKNQLLLRWQSPQQRWEQVTPDSVLVAGERLLVPPGFRPQIVLDSGVVMTVVGYSSWQWVAGTTSPRLHLNHGRFVFRRDEQTVETTHVQCGERQGWLQLPNEKSQVAVEAWHYLAAGKDPRKEISEIALRVYQVQHGAWTVQEADTLPAKPPEIVLSRALGDTPFEELVETDLPGWMKATDASASFEGTATIELTQLITADQPLLPQLQEHQANHRLHEVRALAARSLAVLGDYDMILETFHDKSYRASWEKHLDLLQDLIAQGSETAVELESTLERQREEDGKHLFRLLWGYDSDQLAGGNDRKLVQWLSNKAVDIRVLAFLNLKRTTGKTQLFFPEKPVAQQSTAIRGWTRLLEEGVILPAGDPVPWNR